MTAPVRPIIAQLAAARVAAGLTQVDLAKLLHVSRNAVTSWETGARVPPLQRIEEWAAAVGEDLVLVRRPR